MNFHEKTAPGAGAKKKFGRKTIIICVVATALLFAFAAGSIYGKYTHQSTGDGLVTAQEFYFNSDVLGEESGGVYPLYELAAGTGSISFDLENFADELRYTNYPIDYIVTVPGKSPVTGTIEAGEGKKATIEVDTSGFTAGETYTVTAETTGGYYKIIGARFKIAVPDTGLYAYLDTLSDSHYVELTIWTEDISSAVTITAPSGRLIPDTTRGVESIEAVTLNANESVKLRYFKENLSDTFAWNSFEYSTAVTPGTPH